MPTTSFGELLRFLRRRARLTQRDLGVAVGYSEAHINRFEKNKRLPDPTAVAALFVPALDLKNDPELAQRLIELARPVELVAPGLSDPLPATLESIPPAPAFESERPRALTRLRGRLSAERRVVLAGLPGVGKTALAAELARTYTAAMPVFWLTLTKGVTAFADTLIYQLAAFLAAHGQTQLKTLLPSSGGSSSLPLDRRIALLSAALNRQSALLCLDNAELIAENQSALQVLRHLAATTSAYMLLTSRESLPLTQVAEMQLTGLEHDEGMVLVSCLSEDQVAADVAGRLVEKTDGNPMLIRLAVTQIMDERAEPSLVEQLESQPQVTSYLLETVQKLSTPPEWRLLSLLAVFQKPVNLYDEYLVEQMHTLKETRGAATAIPELQRRHLIDHPTRAELHPLIRDYVYHALAADPTRRRRLHRLAADWYAERSRDSLSAAFHYAAAGFPDQATEAIMHDEKGISLRGQVLAAVAVLDGLLARHKERREMPDDLLRQLLATRGDLLTTTLRGAEAEVDFRHALSLATNPAVRADLVCRMGMILLQRGRFADASQLIQEARRALPAEDKLLHARLLAQECQAQELESQLDAAQASGEQALALANELAAVSPLSAEEVRVEVYLTLANVARFRRRVDTAIEYASRALASSRQAGTRLREISSLSFIGGMLFDSGDLEGSLRYRQDALAGAEGIEDQVGAGYYLTHLSEIDQYQLRPESALEKLGRAVRILEDTGEIRGLASALSLRATILILQGRLEEARAAILRVLNEMQGPATHRSWGYYLEKLAIVEMVEGQAGAAESVLRRAFAVPDLDKYPMLDFELHTTLALAQVAEEKSGAAQQTLNESPHLDGLSIWVRLDRDLAESCVEFACGRAREAVQLAAQIAHRCAPYPYYRQRAVRLASAFETAAPVSTLPRLVWVMTE